MSEYQKIFLNDYLMQVHDKNWLLIDIRQRQDYDKLHIPSAKSYTEEDVHDFLIRGDRNQAVLVYCYNGTASQTIAQTLIGEDFNEVYSLIGGFRSWLEHMAE